MNFPDTELALKELIETVAPRVVLWLPADMHSKLPVVQISLIPSVGDVEPFLRTERVQIDVYAAGRSAAKELSATIRTLLSGPQETSYGLLDDVYIDTEFAQEPYTHDTTTLFTGVVRVDSRPLPN